MLFHKRKYFVKCVELYLEFLVKGDIENMAYCSDKVFFTYVWRIENFSMCPQQKGECINSPDFVVDALDKTTWHLELFPKGDSETKEDCLSCYLWRGSKEKVPEEITVSFDIELVSLNVKSYTVCGDKRTFKKSSGHGYRSLKTLSTLMENKKTLLPYDALTVLLAVRRAESSDEETEMNLLAPHVNYTCSVDKSSTVISDVSDSSKHRLDTCIVNTRIPLERSQLKWIIKDFKSKMQTANKISATFVSSLREKSEIILQCYIKGDWDSDGSVMIDIQRKDIDLQQMLLKCEVSVLDKNGVAQETVEDQHLFREDYEIWILPPVIKLSTIQNRISDLMDGQDFTLQFQFITSYKVKEIEVFGSELKIIGSADTNNLQDIREFLEDLKLSDATLISEGLELPVHKSVICTRSPVFNAMFTNDTEEKRTGVVRITDIEADTLRNLKNFMYGNQLVDLQPEEAMKLYSAAYKYEILELMERCVAYLKYDLSFSNMCEVLSLADLHQDEDLLECVYDFLRVHSGEVFKSKEWKNLMKINLELAGETMRKLLLKLITTK